MRESRGAGHILLSFWLPDNAFVIASSDNIILPVEPIFVVVNMDKNKKDAIITSVIRESLVILAVEPPGSSRILIPI